MRRHHRLLLATLTLLLVPLAACGGDDEGSGATTTITVLAASSLTDAFGALAEQFEADHDGVEMRLAFDSSATLAEQALGGAPADVLATADTATMDGAADALSAEPQVFATNTMVVVTPADNLAAILDYDDLDRDGVRYVVCVDTAPCGKVAAALIASTGLDAEPASLEVDVRSVLAKVVADEADAGFVFASDAVAAGAAVGTIQVPGAADVVTTYPIATLAQSGDTELAQEFVDLVLSDAGQALLAVAGFGPAS